jgi:hypothetical protein
MSEVSQQAQQLYDWMLSIKTCVPDGDRYIVVCDFETKEYTSLLTELRNAKWIQSHQSKKRVVLGIVVPTLYLWGRRISTIDSINLLMSAYDDLGRDIIESTFKLFATKRGRQDLSDLQKREELEYYAKFDTNTVIRGLRTYHSLPPDQQYGPQYARGIIRNEKARIACDATKTLLDPIGTLVEKVAAQPNTSHQLKKLRSKWVQSRIDLVHFSTLSDYEQTEYIQSLEREYDRTFGCEAGEVEISSV